MIRVQPTRQNQGNSRSAGTQDHCAEQDHQGCSCLGRSGHLTLQSELCSTLSTRRNYLSTNERCQDALGIHNDRPDPGELSPGTTEKIMWGSKESFKWNNPPMYPNLRTNCIRVIEEAMTKKRAKGATVSYSGGVEKLSGGSRVRECRELGEEEPQEPALPTPATFVGLAVSAPPPDRYIDSAQSGATTVETAFIARDLPRRQDMNKNRPLAYNRHAPEASSSSASSCSFFGRDEGESRNVHGSEIERLERMLVDELSLLEHLKVNLARPVARPDIRNAMGVQRTIPRPGMKTRPTMSIPSKRLLSTVLPVLAWKRRTQVSKASPGSAGETTTSCSDESTRHSPLRAEASPT